jgi:2-polyprenyl-3-methyl-5-hydroxy-6-metoxy-1,4-benzoquinol methylase
MSTPTRRDRTDRIWDADVISDQGERVSHLVPDHVFHAHLSIYDFALPWVRGASILDAGSGSGYGSAYLADAGAKYVIGLERSAHAVEFSRYHFQRSNLEYRIMDLGEIAGLPPHHFDLVFSSNTLEHVSKVRNFFHSAWSLLKPNGVLLLAVPPVTSPRLEYLNLVNQYHLNIWTPLQWSALLKDYFREVTPYMHGIEEIGRDFTQEQCGINSNITPKSFVIKPCSIEEMYQKFTLTAIFQARGPVSEDRIPSPETAIHFVDNSYSRPTGYIDPATRSRLEHFFVNDNLHQDRLLHRAYSIWQELGFKALIRRALSKIFRDR